MFRLLKNHLVPIHVPIISAAALILFICLLRHPPTVESRSYNNGLIFYDLATEQAYLPPTVSVSRGRILAPVKYSAKGSIWSTFGQPCDCQGVRCECCVGVKVLQYKYDKKLCTNITYVPSKEEAIVDVRLNNATTIKYGMTTRNPSPACLPLPLGVQTEACMHFTNIGLQGNNLNMCMDLVMRVGVNSMMEMHFQCMRFGLDGLQYVDKDGNPVIPPSDAKAGDGDGDDEYYDEVNENDIADEEGAHKDDNEMGDGDGKVEVDDREQQHEMEADVNAVEGEQPQEFVGDEEEAVEEPAVADADVEEDVKVAVVENVKEDEKPVHGESLQEMSENAVNMSASDMTTEGIQQEEEEAQVDEEGEVKGEAAGEAIGEAIGEAEGETEGDAELEEEVVDKKEEAKVGEDKGEVEEAEEEATEPAAEEEGEEVDKAAEETYDLVTVKETESETTTIANSQTTAATTPFSTTTTTDQQDMQITTTTTTELPTTTTTEGVDSDYDSSNNSDYDDNNAYATIGPQPAITTTPTTTTTTTVSTPPLNDNGFSSYGDNYATQTIETHTVMADDRTAATAAAAAADNDLFTLRPSDELTEAPIDVTTPDTDLLAMASDIHAATTTTIATKEPSPYTEAPQAVELADSNSLARRSKWISHLHRRRSF